MAERHYTIEDDGLSQDWRGRAWVNPPYGPELGAWLYKLARHRDGGIALIFARTETRPFFDNVWGRASAIFFFRGRLHFYDVAGKRATANAGGPSVLCAYRMENVDAIERAGLDGQLVRLR